MIASSVKGGSNRPTSGEPICFCPLRLFCRKLCAKNRYVSWANASSRSDLGPVCCLRYHDLCGGSASMAPGTNSDGPDTLPTPRRRRVLRTLACILGVVVLALAAYLLLWP